jgi:hypothetical protein
MVTIQIPDTARIVWNTIGQLSIENRSPQESIFLATFENDTYFVDYSFYNGS